MTAQYSEADLRRASLWHRDHPMVGESAIAQLIADVRAAQRETDAHRVAQQAEVEHSLGCHDCGAELEELAKRIREGK